MNTILLIYQFGAALVGSIACCLLVYFALQHMGARLYNALHGFSPWDVDYLKSHILSERGYWLCLLLQKACLLVLVVVLWPLWLGFIMIRLAIGAGVLIK